MLISEAQEMAGSVSGGCVEGAVVKAAQQVLVEDRAQLLDFGVSNDEAWTVGLSCGGRIQVMLTPFPKMENKIWGGIVETLHQNQGCVWISPVMGSSTDEALLLAEGTSIGTILPTVQTAAKLAYQERKSQLIETEGVAYFLHVLPKKSQLFLIGAAHLTADLIDLAHHFEFESIVIDPRGIFAHKTQFPKAPDQLFNDYPSEVLSQFPLDHYTYAVTLSHDPKIDDNALEVLLNSKVAYIGALGSKRTHAKRVARLLEKGYDQAAIDRIHGPVGLSINAKTPKEIALSILAQIIEVQNQYL
jgi:xanthine dehydrogenase accessory factor